MSRESLIDEVLSLVSGVLKRPVDQRAELGKTERWDSVRHIQIVLALEKRFNVRMRPRHISALTTIPAILDYLMEEGVH